VSDGGLMGSAQLAEATTVLAPIRLRNAAEQIADRLVTAIALGEFVPGQRLPTERELSAMLDVNRTAVREAMHRLAGAGYLEVRRGRSGGAFVKNSWGSGAPEMIHRTLAPHWQDFEALFDMRRLVESMIARAAAERRAGEDIAPLLATVEAYAAAGDDREASRAADHALHTAIASATDNPYLASLSQQIRAQVSLGFQAEPYSPEIRAVAIDQHRELVQAVVDGRADDAAALAAEHFSLTEGALRRLLDRVQEGR
jgi:GntR family transcriptional regulator, transcriptional repressor for pyruvate dehydrogenase complex